MTKELIITILIVIIQCALLNDAHSQQFTYIPNKIETNIQSVKFKNGVELSLVSANENGNRRVITNSNVKVFGVGLISDDVVEIVAAYPNEINAGAVLIKSTCNGTACSRFTTVHIAYPERENLRIDYVGNQQVDKFEIKVNIKNNTLISATAKNIEDDTKNKYGDIDKINQNLIIGTGFISEKFNKSFLKILTSNGEDFFSSNEFREAFAKKIGYDNFRELRDFTNGPGNTILVDGKYILIERCKAHQCPEFNGKVLIDATTNNFWAVWIDRNKKNIKQGTTSEWTDAISYKLLNKSNWAIFYDLSYENNTFKFK